MSFECCLETLPCRRHIHAVLVLDLDVRILDDAFRRIHVHLDVGIHAHDADDRARELQREGHGEARQRGAHALERHDRDDHDGREGRADHGLAERHPAVEEPEVRVGGRVGVDPVVHARDVLRALAPRADRGQAGERGAEVLEDGALGVGLEALDLPRAEEVAAADPGRAEQQEDRKGPDVDRHEQPDAGDDGGLE